MAGKGKKQGNQHAAPNSARGMMGHLGLKSSALAPTDSKLTSQYMVLDHMTAHYKNLSKAKSAIDNKTPKAWLISQKARDKARRQALKDEHNRRNQWLAGSISSRPPTRDSERDRDDLIAMMESFSALDEDYDDLDGVPPNVSSSVTTSKANRLNEDDMNFVNNMVSDSAQSPSRYHSQKVMKTNIPSNKSKPYSKPSHSHHKEAVQIPSRAHKQSSGDLIEKQSHKFTEEKPFTPRTLKSKMEVPSRLTSFKYYTAPKKSARDAPAPVPAPRGAARRGSMVSRPETAYSDSVDLMNETLMSRDHGLKDKPMGVPALDISLDADNMRWMKEHAQQGWLQEQSKKAHIRASAGARSDAGSDIGSSRYEPRHEVRGAHTRTLNGTHTMTGRYPSTFTSMKMEQEEEELKYLEFVTDVTNDVLDRGIFTNRVLKQVFDTHIERRKHELKTSRMYEMLDDLRQDLGIPDDNDDEDMGMRSVRSPELHTETTGSFDGTATYTQNTGPRAARRKQLNGSADDYGTRGSLPNLRGGRRRVNSGEGRPPLPRPVSRGSRSRPGSSCSNLQDVKEEAEDSSLTFTFSDTPTSSGQANILKIDHDDPEPLQRMEDAENGSSEEMMVNGTSELDGYHQGYHRQDDRDPGDDLQFENRHKGLHDTGLKPLSVNDDMGDGQGSDERIEMSGAHETFHARTGSQEDEDERDDLTDLYTKQIDQTSDGEDSRLSRGDSYKDDTRLSLGDNDMTDTRLLTNDMNDTRLSADGSDKDDTRLALCDNDDTHLSLGDHDDYSDAFHEDDQDTLREDSVAETPRSAPPKPTPRSRKAVSSSEFTPRSTELTHTTSESVTVSELGTEDGDF